MWAGFPPIQLRQERKPPGRCVADPNTCSSTLRVIWVAVLKRCSTCGALIPSGRLRQRTGNPSVKVRQDRGNPKTTGRVTKASSTFRKLSGNKGVREPQFGAKSKSSLKRTAKSLSSFQRTFAFSPLALAKPTVGTASRNETLIVQGGA
jgi:hypothetical protein